MINISLMTEWFAVLVKTLFSKEEAAECLAVSKIPYDSDRME